MSEFNPRRSRAKQPLPLWVDAFLRDTMLLETDEFGAYSLLIYTMWTDEWCRLPDDSRKLARICRVSPRRWTLSLRAKMEPFFQVEDGWWRQKKLGINAAFVEKQCSLQHLRKTGKKSYKYLNCLGEVSTVEGSAVKPRSKTEANASDDLEAHNSAMIAPRFPVSDCNSSKGPQPDYRLTYKEGADAPLSVGAEAPPDDVGEKQSLPSTEKQSLPSSSKQPDPIMAVVDAYNAIASIEGMPWPEARVMNGSTGKKRRGVIGARIKDEGGDPAAVIAILQRAADAPHLIGDNDRGWTASLDWILKAENFAKVKEGNYDRKPGIGPGGGAGGRGVSQRRGSHGGMFEALAGAAMDSGRGSGG